MRLEVLAAFSVWALSAILAVCVWGSYPDDWWFPFAISAVLAAAYFTHPRQRGRRFGGMSAVWIWAALTAAFALLQALPIASITTGAISVAPLRTIRFLGWFLACLSCYAIVVRTGRCLLLRHAIPLLFSPLVAIGAIEAVIAMLQRANQDFDELSTGTFASHASLSCFLCAVLPLSAFVGSQLFAIGNRKLASIFAIESVLVAGGVLASFSRVGWLFLGFFAVATAVRHAKTHRLTAVVATAIFAGVVFFSMSPQYLESRLGRLNSWSGLRHDLNVNRWGSALQLFAKAPTFGHGAGAFPVAYSVYIGRKKGDEVPEVPSAENDYLQMLAELGLTGSVLLCGLAISFLRQVRLDVRASDAVTREFLWAAAASLGAVGLHCLLDRQITRPAIAFEVAWICGLIVACGGGSLRKYPT